MKSNKISIHSCWILTKARLMLFISPAEKRYDLIKVHYHQRQNVKRFTHSLTDNKKDSEWNQQVFCMTANAWYLSVQTWAFSSYCWLNRSDSDRIKSPWVVPCFPACHSPAGLRLFEVKALHWWAGCVAEQREALWSDVSCFHLLPSFYHMYIASS